jgi:serine/threonine-protein kinase/serine/threonine-protein kinase PknK
MNIARELRLPRLETRLLHEGVRLAAISGEPIDESMARRIATASSHQLDGIGDVAAELIEDAHIRLLLIDGTPSAFVEACQRARARLEHVDNSRRLRASLRARLQCALCLDVAGNRDEANLVLAPGAENLCRA